MVGELHLAPRPVDWIPGQARDDVVLLDTAVPGDPNVNGHPSPREALLPLTPSSKRRGSYQRVSSPLTEGGLQGGAIHAG